MSEPKRIAIREQADIVSARQTGRELARQLGFGAADQTRLATAVSELARNALQFAGSGRCEIRDASNRDLIKIRVRVEDSGPGISDLESAMTDGFSTSNGLGAGLPGARRLVHEFDIESRPGRTAVTVAMVRKRAP